MKFPPVQLEFADQGFKNIPKGKLTGVDLFAGAGGFSCGMSMGGIEVVGAVELDPGACWTLRANKLNSFPNMTVIQEDITTLSGKDILTRCGVKSLDVLFGGPPCQGFSSANLSRSVNDPRSKLMFEFIRMVGEIRPKIFIIENVPGLLTFKEFFKFLMGSLEHKGYRVRFNMFDAANYGVPQRRKRIFINGIRSDLNRIPSWSHHTHFDDPHQDSKKPKSWIPPSLMAEYLFPVNGFHKSAVGFTKWNQKLGIMMDMRKIEQQFNAATTRIFFESTLRTNGLA